MRRQITAALGDKDQLLDDTPAGRLKVEMMEFFEDVKAMQIQWIYTPQVFSNITDKFGLISEQAQARITNAWVNYKSLWLCSDSDYTLLVERMVRSLDLVGVWEISFVPAVWKLHNCTNAMVEAVSWGNVPPSQRKIVAGPAITPIDVVKEFTSSNQHLVMIYVMHLALNLN